MAIVFAEERLKTAETMMSRRRRGDRTGSAGGLWERQGLAGDVRSGRTLRAGDRAPRFRLVDEAQQPVTLTDELQHGPVVLSFLAGDGAAQAIGRLAQWAGRIAEAGGSLFAVLPDVPAVAETLPGFEVDTWWGLVVPAATPKDVVTKLNQAFVAALNNPEVKARFATLMAEPVPTTPEQFGSFMNAERAKYEKVVKASGAKVD